MSKHARADDSPEEDAWDETDAASMLSDIQNPSQATLEATRDFLEQIHQQVDNKQAKPNPPATVNGRPVPFGLEKMRDCCPMRIERVGNNDRLYFGMPPGARACEVTSVFIQKGGVGKTTLIGSFAWELAMIGRRVMVVDADPQCNLSEWLIPDFAKFSLTQQYRDNCIGSLLQDIIEGNQNQVHPVQCHQCRNPGYPDGAFPNGGALFVLPGDFNLSRSEMNIAIGCHTGGHDEAKKNIPGALPYGIRATAWLYDVDHVLIDCSPSGGVVNQLLVMTSDSFLIPVNPSLFSLQTMMRGAQFFQS